MGLRSGSLVLVAFVTCWAVFGAAQAFAGAPVLIVRSGDQAASLSAADLLGRRDATEITVTNDLAYQRTMTYQAIPLRALIRDHFGGSFDTLEARATDGYVSQIPLSSIIGAEKAGAVAWLAIENPNAKWPNLPGKDTSAGPFYLVWVLPKLSDARGTQWPYAIHTLTARQSPVVRWPQLAVAATLGADAPERVGQKIFLKTCFACHRMKRGGDAEIGPDLGHPMGPTQYMTDAGLRKLIRDPKSVRTWPDQKMPGFDEGLISNSDLDALIAYLQHMSSGSTP